MSTDPIFFHLFQELGSRPGKPLSKATKVKSFEWINTETDEIIKNIYELRRKYNELLSKVTVRINASSPGLQTPIGTKVAPCSILDENGHTTPRLRPQPL